MRIEHTKNKKTFRTIAALLLLAAIAVGGYWYYQSVAQPTVNPPDTGNIPTRQEESEGQTVTVPETVEEGRVKNYELLTSNSEFKIRRLGESYTITLYAIINRPDQYEQYQQQLKIYKEKALGYMQEQGISIEEVEITYEPEEAKDL